MKFLHILSAVAILTGTAFASITPYFSPVGGCTEVIVAEIERAHQSIRVQAYSFTSAPIADALAKASQRGIRVEVILDKSQQSGKYSSLTFLRNHGIATWIDFKPAIAHSKVMIIDGRTLITGSFNFTKAAEEKNTENLLIIKDELDVIRQYIQNFENRKAESLNSNG